MGTFEEILSSDAECFEEKVNQSLKQDINNRKIELKNNELHMSAKNRQYLDYEMNQIEMPYRVWSIRISKE